MVEKGQGSGIRKGNIHADLLDKPEPLARSGQPLVLTRASPGWETMQRPHRSSMWSERFSIVSLVGGNGFATRRGAGPGCVLAGTRRTPPGNGS